MNTAIISKMTHNNTRIKVSTMLSTSTKIYYWHIPEHSPLSEALLHEEATRQFLRAIGLMAEYKLVSGYIDEGVVAHILQPILESVSSMLAGEGNEDNKQTTAEVDNNNKPEGHNNNTAIEAEKKETV